MSSSNTSTVTFGQRSIAIVSEAGKVQVTVREPDATGKIKMHRATLDIADSLTPSAMKLRKDGTLGINRDDIAVAKLEYIGDVGKCACLHQLTTYAGTYRTYFSITDRERGRVQSGVLIKPTGHSNFKEANAAQTREFLDAVKVFLTERPEISYEQAFKGSRPTHGVQGSEGARQWALRYMVSLATRGA